MARRSRSGTRTGAPPEVEELAAPAHHHSAEAQSHSMRSAVARGIGPKPSISHCRLSSSANARPANRSYGITTSAPAIGRDWGNVAAAGTFTEQHQRIRASLRSGAHVGRPLGRLQIVEDAPDDGRRLGIEETAEGAPGRRRGEREATLVERKAGISRASSSSARDAHRRVTRGKSCTSTVAAASSSTVSYSS